MHGEVPERFNGAHRKCDGPRRGHAGSNPAFSASVIRARRLMDRAAVFYTALCGFESLRARQIPGSSSGRTAGSEPANRGSNPCPGTTFCTCGGTGRRGSLKPCCRRRRAGSTPARCTMERCQSPVDWVCLENRRPAKATKVQILHAPPISGSLAQRQSRRLLSGRAGVRVSHGPPGLYVAAHNSVLSPITYNQSIHPSSNWQDISL